MEGVLDSTGNILHLRVGRALTEREAGAGEVGVQGIDGIDPERILPRSVPVVLIVVVGEQEGEVNGNLLLPNPEVVIWHGNHPFCVSCCAVCWLSVVLSNGRGRALRPDARGKVR